jgi:phosphoglycolate phosphatase
VAGTLIFDLDGTLSDPLEGIGRSINHALEHHGLASRPLTELARFVGPPLDGTFRELAGVDAPVASLVARYRDRYSVTGYAENRLYDGIAPVLAALAEHRVLGLCTSKRADFAEKILVLFGLRDHFAFVSGGDIGITKADQLRDLRETGTIDGDAIMIGDRAVDIESAHANGLAGCGVLWGFGSRDELEAARPRWLLASPIELATLRDE